MLPKRLFALVAALSLSGCGASRDVYERPLEVLGPFPIQGGLCFLDRTLGELVRVWADPAAVRLDRMVLRSSPRLLVEVSGGNKLAVLHDDLDRPGVSLLSPAGSQVERWLPLSERFDALALSPSSRFGVAYFSSAARPSQGILNLNQIQVVDFTEGRVHAPLMLETGGLNPRGVDFLPAGSGTFDDIAAVRVDNGLVLVDLADELAEPLWVRFTNNQDGSAVPAQVAFGPFFADGGYLYVRLQASLEVFSVHLTRGDDGKLRRSVNFLDVPAGRAPSDLLVLPGQDFREKVFVVFSGKGAAILDANAIQTDERFFDLPGPVTNARLLIGQGADGPHSLVVVYGSSQSAGATSPLFIVDPESTQVETVQVQDPYDRVGSPDDGSVVVLFHPSLQLANAPGLRVIRMEQSPGSGKWSHRVATFSLNAALSGTSFGVPGMMLGAMGGDQAGAIELDLATGQYNFVILDKPPTGAGLVPGTGWSFFQHAAPLGSLTLVPTGAFERDSALMVEGFILEGLLDP